MEWLSTYQGLATIGLGLDMVGVCLLFWFGMPPTLRTPKKWKDQGLYFGSPYDTIMSVEGSGAQAMEEHGKYLNRWKRRRNYIAQLALGLVVIGFGLQIVALYL